MCHVDEIAPISCEIMPWTIINIMQMIIKEAIVEKTLKNHTIRLENLCSDLIIPSHLPSLKRKLMLNGRST